WVIFRFMTSSRVVPLFHSLIALSKSSRPDGGELGDPEAESNSSRVESAEVASLVRWQVPSKRKTEFEAPSKRPVSLPMYYIPLRQADACRRARWGHVLVS